MLIIHKGQLCLQFKILFSRRDHSMNDIFVGIFVNRIFGIFCKFSYAFTLIMREFIFARACRFPIDVLAWQRGDNRSGALALAGTLAWQGSKIRIGKRISVRAVVGPSGQTGHHGPPVHPLSFLAVTFAVGALAMLPFSVMEHFSGRTVRWTTGTLLAFSYVVTLPSLVAYLLYNRATDLIGASRAGQFLNLMPLFGAALAILFLGETLGSHHLIGGFLILLGILGFAASEK